MGSSRNPAKAAAEQQTKMMVREVEDAIRAGRRPVIPYSDSTRITIDSTDAEEASLLVRALQPVEVFDLQTIFHHAVLAAQLGAHKKANRKVIGKFITDIAHVLELAEAVQK